MRKAHTACSAIKGPEMTNVKQFKREINSLIYIQKWTKNKYVTHQQTTTTGSQAPDFGQAHTGGGKHVSGIPTLSLTLDSGVTV